MLPASEEPQVASSTAGYFFREAVRRLWVSKRTSMVAISMIAIALLILGIFLLVSENLSRAVDRWEGSSRITIYLEQDASASHIAGVDGGLAKHPSFSRRHFVSRDEALSRFKSYFKNLSPVIDELDENPFPPSFEVDVSRQTIEARRFNDDMTVIRRLPGVDSVEFDWEWVARLRNVISIINVIGFFVGGILALGAAFMIANVIRLSMVLYREEIEIMRLVGATERVIRAPFLIDGFLQGTLGGLLAIGLLVLVFAGVRQLVGPTNALLWDFLFVRFLPWPKALALVGGGMLAGILGSWFSLRDRSEEVALTP